MNTQLLNRLPQKGATTQDVVRITIYCPSK